MRLESYLSSSRTLAVQDASGRDEVLQRLADVAGAALPEVDAETLYKALLDRESQMPTSTPEGVGFPHALLPGIRETVIVAATLKPGVSFGVEDHPPVDLVFSMFGSSGKPWEHVRLLARLARIARGHGALDRLRGPEDAQGFYEAILEEDRSHD
jgi:PTS system nitrogen regulatory IIA component